MVAHGIPVAADPASFDRVIVPILNRLARCKLADVDKVIDASLAELGALTGVDRTYVFVRRDEDFIDNTNEWTAAGIDPMIEYLQDLHVSVIDPWLDPFSREVPILVPDAAAIPEDEPAHRLLAEQGIRSLLIAPMIDHGKWIGFLGFDWVKAPLGGRAIDVFLLQSVANGIGALLMRRRADFAQRDSQARLTATLAAMPDLVIELDHTGRVAALHTGCPLLLVAPADQMISRPLEDFAPPDVAAVQRAMMGEVDRDGRSAAHRYSLSNATATFWFEAIANRIDATSAGTPHGYLFVIRDVTDRIHAEAALHAREALMNSLFQKAPFGIILRDAETDKTVDVNPAFVRSSGRPRDALLALKADRLVPPEHRHDARRAMTKADADGSFGPFLTALRHVNGGHFPASASGVVHVRPDGRKLVWTFVEDLTERRQQEAVIDARSREAQEARARLEAALDAFPDGFVLFDADGKLAHFNRQYSDIHPGMEDFLRPGLTQEDILTEGYNRGLYVRLNGHELHSLDDLLQRRGKPPTEREAELADGRVIRVRDTAMPDGGLVGVRSDVTAARRAEWRLSNVVEGAQVGIWEWDIPTGTNNVNERWAGMLGYPLAAMLPVTIQTWDGLIHPEDKDRTQRELSDTIADKKKQYEIEFRMRHADGHWVWVQSRGRVVRRSRDGTPLLMAGVHIDVTALKEAEQRLEETIQGAQAGTWQLNLITNINTVDQRVAAIIGETTCDVTQRDMAYWRERIHPDDHAAMAGPGMQGLSDQDGQFSLEIRIRHRAGHWVWILVRGRATRFLADGRPELLSGILIDISDEKSREVALRAARDDLQRALAERDNAEKRFFDIAEISADWFWEQDADLRFTFISDSFGRINGGMRMHIGKTLRALVPDSSSVGRSADWGNLFTRMTARLPFRDFVFRTLGPGDVDFWVRISGSPYFDSEGNFAGYRGVGSDITALYQAKERAEHLATRDPLTGLANRTAFQDRLRSWVAEAAATDRIGAVMMLDLDNFKTINDSFGHDAGDGLLRQVAERLTMSIRPGDLIARQGGDEFTLLLPDARSEDAIDMAWRLIEQMGQPYDLRGQSLFVSVSIGITSFPQDAQSAPDLLQNADIAMYRAKTAGRGQFALFRPELRAEQARRTEMIQAMHRALREDRFRLVLQPKFDLADPPCIVGAEALLRWRDPDFLEVPPGQFIPLAESTGLIFEIDLLVVTMAAGILAHWGSSGLVMPLAVNISAQSVQQKTIVDDILERLATAGVDPRQLQLEITETALMQRTEVTFRNIRRLEAAGINVVIDDFGTGYSSLSYLQELPLAGLKIDQSFVAKLGHDDTGTEAIVRAILAMAGALGMRTVAEGVETPAQLAWLRAQGCDSVQGFLLGAPMTPAAFEAVITARAAGDIDAMTDGHL